LAGLNRQGRIFIWYGKQRDNAPSAHSIFFMKDGHAIHGVKNLGNSASRGCVRI
jgi:hypothetical protein